MRSGILGLAVTAMLLAATGCCSLEDAWRASFERDRAALRETLADGEPGDHLGLYLDLARLSALVADLPESARPRFERRFSLGAEGSNAPAVVLRLESTGLTFAAAECDGCLDVTLAYRASIDPDVGEGLKAALGIPAQGLVREGTIAFQARLFVAPKDGGAQVSIDLWLGLREALRSTLSLLPARWAEIIQEKFEPAERLLGDARVGALGLLRLRARQESATGLATAVRAIHTDRDKNQLYLGLTTNLNVPGSELLEYTGPVDLGPASLRLRAPRGLFEALARAALAGRLGAAGNIGKALSGGKTRLTLNRLDFANGKIAIGVKLWRTHFPCVEADIALTAGIERGPDGRLRIALSEPVIEGASRGEARVREAIEKKKDMLRAFGEQLSKFLNEKRIDIGESRELQWLPILAEIGRDSIMVDVSIQNTVKQQ